MRQKKWDEYEVALLIEAYQNIKQRRMNRKTALIMLSQNLRQMAIKKDPVIDNIFRNLNGMYWQLWHIEKLLVGKEEDPRAAHIFVEVVTLYKDNPQAFQIVLDEAHRRVAGEKSE